ncbi:MAG: DUF3046 domain-containing protein [Propionibacteriaceae bacterium]|nr:DUF3046 domain-containing protein [Propionibacteriaceae bacterium]
MFETELWRRMTKALGEAYVHTWAETQVLSGLQGRTVVQALRDGDPHVKIWRAVWAALELPASER